MRRTYSRHARCSQNLCKSPNQITTVCRMSRASSEVRPIISRPFCELFAYVWRHSHDIRTYVVRTSHKLRKNGNYDSIVARHSEKNFSKFWTLRFFRHLHPLQIVHVPRENRTLGMYLNIIGPIPANKWSELFFSWLRCTPVPELQCKAVNTKFEILIFCHALGCPPGTWLYSGQSDITFLKLDWSIGNITRWLGVGKKNLNFYSVYVHVRYEH